MLEGVVAQGRVFCSRCQPIWSSLRVIVAGVDGHGRGLSSAQKAFPNHHNKPVMRAIRTANVPGPVQVGFEEVGRWITAAAVDVVILEIIAHLHHIGQPPVESEI